MLMVFQPRLNPMERVWKLTRRLRTHNRYFPDLEKLVDTVFDLFALWRTPNQTLRRLCAVIVPLGEWEKNPRL